jgi:FkbM family methyltransferase
MEFPNLVARHAAQRRVIPTASIVRLARLFFGIGPGASDHPLAARSSLFARSALMAAGDRSASRRRPRRRHWWTVATPSDLLTILRTVDNPYLLMLDRLGLRRAEYLLRFSDGTRIQVRPGQGDRFAVYETLVRDNYAKALATLRPGATVIDVGANIGCFTVKAGRRAGERGLVVAIEPEPDNYSQIERNICLNDLGNVEIVGCALAGASGSRTFAKGSSALFGSLYGEVDGRASGIGRVTVDVMTLAEICDWYRCDRVDLLKLDCEGAEYEIMLNLPGQFLRCIRRIVAELHRIDDHQPEHLVQYLIGHGFKHDFDGLHHFHVE